MAMIYNPEKYYLVSVEEKTGAVIVSPFHVESIRQELAGPYSFEYSIPQRTTTKVEGELYGTMRILQPKDMDDISYEEVMELIKE